jgi:hypothetical protein
MLAKRHGLMADWEPSAHHLSLPGISTSDVLCGFMTSWDEKLAGQVAAIVD